MSTPPLVYVQPRQNTKCLSALTWHAPQDTLLDEESKVHNSVNSTAVFLLMQNHDNISPTQHKFKLMGKKTISNLDKHF